MGEINKFPNQSLTSMDTLSGEPKFCQLIHHPLIRSIPGAAKTEIWCFGNVTKNGVIFGGLRLLAPPIFGDFPRMFNVPSSSTLAFCFQMDDESTDGLG